MKKKLLAMLALSAVLAMSAGLLAACNDPKDTDEPDTPCTEHVDSNNDGKCDNCGEDMGSEPVTPPEEEVKITDGVFSNQMDASHEALIKLDGQSEHVRDRGQNVYVLLCCDRSRKARERQTRRHGFLYLHG